jgi:hypothetical protein
MNSAYKKGINEGLEQGIEQGREQGLEQGASRERQILVRRMLSLGQSPQAVAEFTGLALEEILQIAAASEEYPAGDTPTPKTVSEPRRRASRPEKKRRKTRTPESMVTSRR